jgi:hypothetical protein
VAISQPLFLVSLIALMPAIAASDQRQPETIVLRGLPPDTACHQSRGPHIDGVGLRNGRVACDSSIVSCDAPGFEPIDTPAAEVCKHSRLPWVRSAQIQLRTKETLSHARIEWHSFGADANWTSQATRLLPPPAKPFIEASFIASRIIRVVRPGASPVSIPTVWLRDSRVWELPSAVAGGEVLIAVEDVPIKPGEFQITPLGRTAKFVQDFAVLTGLPPGEYTLVPVYAGGIVGQSARFEIRSEETTPIYLKATNVGGAQIFHEAGSCSSAEVLTLSKAVTLDAPARKAVELVPVITQPSTPTCDWTVAGLQPGNYRATVYANDQTLASAEFDVQVQQFATVRLAQPIVSAFGRLTLNGEPAAQRTIEFFQTGSSSRISATTDADGNYRVFMSKPGEYLMAVRGWSQTRKVVVRKDETQLDWAVTGGILTVTVNGMVEESHIEIRRANPDTLIWRELPREAVRHSFEGIPFGTFDVIARSKNRSSKQVSVTLSMNDPEKEIILDLHTNRSFLALRAHNGTAIGGAKFSRLFPHPQEVTAGIYSLEGVAPGTELRIKPPAPWAPICIVAPENRDREVVLEEGARALLELIGFERWELGSDLGRISGVRTSDCSVAFADFAIQLISTSGPKIVFEILNYYEETGGEKEYYPASGGKYPVYQANGILTIKK